MGDGLLLYEEFRNVDRNWEYHAFLLLGLSQVLDLEWDVAVISAVLPDINHHMDYLPRSQVPHENVIRTNRQNLARPIGYLHPNITQYMIRNICHRNCNAEDFPIRVIVKYVIVDDVEMG